MSASDILALVAIVVSVGSAVATLYFQTFERRRVAVALGDAMYINYGDADASGGYAYLGAILSLSLVNAGARDALVTLVTATVRQTPEGFQTQARWNALFEPVDAGTLGKSSSPGWKFNGWVLPLAATSRKVVTEWIYFESAPLQSTLPIGEYELGLEVTETRPAGTRWGKVTEQADRRLVARWVGGFTLTKPQADFLESECVAVQGWTQDCCPVELRRRPGHPEPHPRRRLSPG